MLLSMLLHQRPQKLYRISRSRHRILLHSNILTLRLVHWFSVLHTGLIRRFLNLVELFLWFSEFWYFLFEHRELCIHYWQCFFDFSQFLFYQAYLSSHQLITLNLFWHSSERYIYLIFKRNKVIISKDSYKSSFFIQSLYLLPQTFNFHVMWSWCLDQVTVQYLHPRTRLICRFVKNIELVIECRQCWLQFLDSSFEIHLLDLLSSVLVLGQVAVKSLNPLHYSSDVFLILTFIILDVLDGRNLVF